MFSFRNIIPMILCAAIFFATVQCACAQTEPAASTCCSHQKQHSPAHQGDCKHCGTYSIFAGTFQATPHFSADLLAISLQISPPTTMKIAASGPLQTEPSRPESVDSPTLLRQHCALNF